MPSQTSTLEFTMYLSRVGRIMDVPFVMGCNAPTFTGKKASADLLFHRQLGKSSHCGVKTVACAMSRNGARESSLYIHLFL